MVYKIVKTSNSERFKKSKAWFQNEHIADGNLRVTENLQFKHSLSRYHTVCATYMFFTRPVPESYCTVVQTCA